LVRGGAAESRGTHRRAAHAGRAGYKLEQIECNIFIAAGAKCPALFGDSILKSSPKRMLPENGVHVRLPNLVAIP
jgi:hypothetical protein